MPTSNLPGPSAYDDEHGSDHINAILECYLSYISALARKEIPGMLDYCDSDDLVQNVLIKLWHVLQDHPIDSPGAYIRRTVHNEKVVIARRYKPYQFLVEDDEGEIGQGNVMMTMSDEFKNPEEAFLQKEILNDRLNSLIATIDTLHPRQKLAATCTMKDCAEDILEVKEALRHSEMENEVSWPTDKDERQLLKASLPPVRRKLKKLLEGKS